MRGFRSKFIILLIVYFAGFATAIYTLAPVPEGGNSGLQSERSFACSALKSDEFAQRFNVQLHRCVNFIKEKSDQAGEYIKEKIAEYRQSS
jgi:hypothetical protein